MNLITKNEVLKLIGMASITCEVCMSKFRIIEGNKSTSSAEVIKKIQVEIKNIGMLL